MDSDYYADRFFAEGEDLLHKYTQKLNSLRKQMQIQIIATSVETKPTQKGTTYQQLEVTYKNLTYQGKVESKKLMSFGANATSFKALANAQAGEVFEVSVVKNDKGYNDWTSVQPSTGIRPAASAASSPAATTQTTGRSSYETPEERAQRQVYIIRQSSISSAVATLAVGAKSVKPDEVLAVAKQYENYVFDVKDPGPSGFDDFPDFDVPTVE